MGDVDNYFYTMSPSSFYINKDVFDYTWAMMFIVGGSSNFASLAGGGRLFDRKAVRPVQFLFVRGKFIVKL